MITERSEKEKNEPWIDIEIKEKEDDRIETDIKKMNIIEIIKKERKMNNIEIIREIIKREIIGIVEIAETIKNMKKKKGIMMIEEMIKIYKETQMNKKPLKEVEKYLNKNLHKLVKSRWKNGVIFLINIFYYLCIFFIYFL